MNQKIKYVKCVGYGQRDGRTHFTIGKIYELVITNNDMETITSDLHYVYRKHDVLRFLDTWYKFREIKIFNSLLN